MEDGEGIVNPVLPLEDGFFSIEGEDNGQFFSQGRARHVSPPHLLHYFPDHHLRKDPLLASPQQEQG